MKDYISRQNQNRTIMRDLVDFQHERIVALGNRVTELTRLVLELTDNDCTDEYRQLIKTEILKGKL
jgi:hypothetical protein